MSFLGVLTLGELRLQSPKKSIHNVLDIAEKLPYIVFWDPLLLPSNRKGFGVVMEGKGRDKTNKNTECKL